MLRDARGRVGSAQALSRLPKIKAPARPNVNMGAVAQVGLQGPPGPAGLAPVQLGHAPTPLDRHMMMLLHKIASGIKPSFDDILTLNHLKAQQQLQQPTGPPSEHAPDAVAQAEMDLRSQQASQHVGPYAPSEMGMAGMFENAGGLTGWGQHLMGQTAGMLEGIGPGLYHLGGGEAHDIAKNPLYGAAPFLTPTMRGVGRGFAHGVAKTVEHPIRDLKEDPLNAISNVFAGAGAVAGTAARVSELGRAEELAAEQGISKGHQIAKTMLRPRPQERSITVVPPNTHLDKRIPITRFGKEDPGALNPDRVVVMRMPDGEVRVGQPGALPQDAVTPADVEKYGLVHPAGTYEAYSELVSPKLGQHMGQPGTYGGVSFSDNTHGVMVMDAKLDPVTGRVTDLKNIGHAFDDGQLAKGLKETIIQATNHALHGDEAPMRKVTSSAKLQRLSSRSEGRYQFNTVTDHEQSTEAGAAAGSWYSTHPEQAEIADMGWDEYNSQGKYGNTGKVDLHTLRDPQGNIVGIATTKENPGKLIVGTLASPAPGGGATLAMNLIKDAARRGLGVEFSAATDAVDYYERLGLKRSNFSNQYYATPEEVKKLAANKSLQEVESPGLEIHLPAYKSALGGYMQKGYDKFNEKMMRSGRLPSVRDKLLGAGSELRIRHRFIEGALPGGGHIGKLRRQDFERMVRTERGDAEVRIAKENPDMPKDEVQAVAYQQGAALAHSKFWHEWWDSGGIPKAEFDKDPQGFVGVKTPKGEFKSKAYSSEQGFSREWNGMVETDTKKLKANPDAYAMMPRSMWSRMHLYAPDTGTLATGADIMDRGTQMIRIGRLLMPSYAAWAVQNGIIHLTQAGALVFRNVWQLHNEYSKLDPEVRAFWDNASGAGHYGGGVARASEGSRTSVYSGFAHKLGSFWHGFDDAWARRLSLIHELNAHGYHTAEDWTKLAKSDPAKARMIAHSGENNAINYGEMSPSERASFQKVFTAWGWTRGASTYTMRFPLEHPVLTPAMIQAGKQGEQQVNDFYGSRGGMAPEWLRGFLPLGHTNTPYLLSGGEINPAETLGNVMEEIPGLTKGQTASLAQEDAPIPSMLLELGTGQDKYGQPLKNKLTQPVGDAISRFKPLTAIKDLLGTKHGAGTFQQSPLAAFDSFMGIPVSQLTDAKKTAALGMKDYEQSLSRPDEINFRLSHNLQKLPQDVALYKRALGSDPGKWLVGKVKADYHAVAMQDLWQLKYANAHGAHSFRSLPSQNKVTAALSFLTQHHYLTPQDAHTYTQIASQLKDDKELTQLADELWNSSGIGEYSNQWKDTIKKLQPPTLTPARP